MVKGLMRRIQKAMFSHFLQKYDLTFCKMCDNLAHIDHGTCEYCDYELDMMANNHKGDVGMIGESQNVQTVKRMPSGDDIYCLFPIISLATMNVMLPLPRFWEIKKGV